MKRIAVFAAFAACIMVLPMGSASAATDCPNGQQTQVSAGPPVVVCVDLGEAGNNGEPGDSTGFYGGKVEVDPTCTRAVVDGDDDNTFVSDQGGGYAGLSNCETGTKDTNCNGVDQGTGSNSGGCLTLRGSGVPPLPVPLVACGNTTGKSWDTSTRDGCTIP